jgi:uncharacterized repeat protein (TIGR01451 family)
MLWMMNSDTSRNSVSTAALGSFVLTVFMQFFAGTAQSANAEQAETQLLAEVRVVTGEQPRMLRLTPTKKLQQGQEIYYTLRIRNPGTDTMTALSVVQAVPRNTHYVAGSAAGAGADILFSIDGGSVFDRPVNLKLPNDPAHVASTELYTHIRWQLRYPLAPKAVVLARFRAIFQ